MITEHQKFQLPDLDGKNNIVGEVNWEDKDATKNGQVIKFTLPDGKKTFIKRDHLNEILFAIGTKEDQVQLVPEKLQTVHWIDTVIGMKADKDIRKGEMINSRVKLSAPCTNVAPIVGEKSFKKDVKKAIAKDKMSTLQS